MVFRNEDLEHLRLDYLQSKNFNFGVSSSRLSERPFFTKTNFGSDPIKNSMYGFDFNYKTDLTWFNKGLGQTAFLSAQKQSLPLQLMEKLLIYNRVMRNKLVKGGSGVVYLDDFESTRTNIDLRFPFTAWALASTPMDRFKEGTLTDQY